MKSNTKGTPKSTGYLIERFKVTRPARDYLMGLLEKVGHDHTRYLFYHLVASTLSLYKRVAADSGEVWIPVSWTLIREQLRGASWVELEKLGLVTAKDADWEAGLSREFQVNPLVIEKVLAMTPRTFSEYTDSVNLMTGRAMVAPLKSLLYDDNRNREPKLIRDAVVLIRDCIIDLGAIEEHVEKLRRKWEMSGGDPKLKARYINDLMCMNAVFGQNPRELGGGFWAYDPPYRAQFSGRVSHIGGGLQSCSREMKMAAYKNVENLKNYDLKASQAYGLMHQFQLAGLDTSWLEAYLSDPLAKHKYAAEVGISVETWKNCLYAIFMGASLAPDSDQAAVISYLRDESEDDLEASEKMVRFLKVVAGLKGEIDKWHTWLLKTYAPAHAKKSRGGKYVIKNATDKTFVLEDERARGVASCKRRLAAFVLQGQEAAFIHWLTTLGEKYGFKVIANEHDGLITLGEIPDLAVKEAAFATGFRLAHLEEKPWEGQGDHPATGTQG